MTEIIGTKVSVSGTGAVDVAPDIAMVSFGITTRNVDATQAMTANNEAMTTLIAALTAMGIDEDDIRTNHFSVWESHDWASGQRRFIGFEVSNNISVTIRNIDIVGNVLATATANGATMGGGVMFSISDSTAAYHTALALAIQDATGKAQAIAAALGLNYAIAVSITETGGFHQPIAQNFHMESAVMAMSPDMSASMSVPVQTSSLSVTARVQVEFTLLP
jgi:uncharacterized protein YggE